MKVLMVGFGLERQLLRQWFLGQLLYSLKLAGDMGHIAFWAHVGGFVTGAGMASLFQWRRNLQIKIWKARLHKPMKQALTQMQKQSFGSALAALEELEDLVPDSRTLYYWMCGRSAVETDSAQGKALLLRSFNQAKDYGRHHLALNAYLHLAFRYPPESIDAQLHRDAGFLALSLKKDDLALLAFYHSITYDNDDRTQQMLLGLKSLMKRQDCPDTDIAELNKLHIVLKTRES